MLLPLVFGLLVLGSLGLSFGGSLPSAGHAAASASSAAGAVPPAAAPPIAAAQHGDLVVSAANSPYVISPATTGSTTYVQAGNITVLAGGSLLVRDETIDFLQFISDTGPLPGRILHLYHFDVQGSLVLSNSTVTTDTSVINAYPKLTFDVSGGGSVTMASSALAFPGTVTVAGVGSSLTLNQSAITRNPLIPGLVENSTLLADTVYGPSIAVSAGAALNLFNSSISYSYKNNYNASGVPGPEPLTSTALYTISPTSGQTLSNWPLPTDSENVTRALLYPTFAGGTVLLAYSSNNTTSASGNTFSFGGNTYPLPSITYFAGQHEALVPIPATAIAAINAVGPIGWLEATGSFEQAASISLHLGTTSSGTGLQVGYTSIYLTPVLSFNVTVDGAGSVVTAADSSLDLNWNLTPGTSVSSGVPVPTPWASNKLLLTNGAKASLASVSIPSSRTNVYFATSVAIPDATSQVAVYRWAAIPVLSSVSVAISAAQATAFYSYDASQSNNVTATSLNDLASADPALAQYVASWDTAHGILGYGQSGPDGVAFLLLASSLVGQATLPDGTFLGGYHVAVTLSGGGSGSTQWGFVAVTPYPGGMTPASPDRQNPYVYTNYAPALAFTNTTIVVASQPQTSPTVAIGQAITFSATLTNVGTGPVQNFSVNLSWAQPAPLPPMLVAPTQTFATLPAGAEQTVALTWIVNESVVGDLGYTSGQFLLSASWNGGVAPAGGVTTQTIPVAIQPAVITLTFTPPTGTLTPGVEYIGSGTVLFNGSGQASLVVTAIAPNGAQYLVAEDSVHRGSFNLSVVVSPDMPSGSYTVQINATYNARSAVVSTLNAFTIAGAPSTAPPFWEQKVLGLMLLYWIIIAAAIVAGVLAFLFLARRTARGKLVECGECGALIPETATQCPQCGAEFENDLVRCSRCGSTIPATSQVCPECAAQLLGSPEEEARDPERQGYADVVERFRAEAKKELGDNYSEGAFWDWWKRQSTYLSFSQWRLQQAQGSRAGMGAPPEETPAPTRRPPTPPRGGGASGGARGGAAPRASTSTSAARPVTRTAPAATPPAAPAAEPAPTPAAGPSTTGAPTAAMKACSNCGKEIPPDYLVCPFCGAVTQ